MLFLLFLNKAKCLTDFRSISIVDKKSHEVEDLMKFED